MIDDKSLGFPELDGAKPRHPGQCDRLQPELRQAALALNVDMWRFGAFVAEEEEPVWAYPGHSRHRGDLTFSGCDCLSDDRLDQRNRRYPSLLFEPPASLASRAFTG